jgi:putative sigma-54 modulation protein
MKVDITGRHIEITEPLRAFATDRHIAEANIKTRHDFHHCEEVSTDMYTSIAAVLDKIEKQILRSKGKNQARKRRNNGEVITGTTREAEVEIGEKIPRIIRSHEIAAKPLSVDDAAVEVDESKAGFLVFRNAETQRLNVVYKRKDGNIGWIEPEA